ncbi:hypothetical protein [Methylobacterium nonmethylotrophicum]|uniref:Uncharacterized protein n=1 Tax=Methylobacterium nonmethylotrophicum TaxID=1141884 RepID=A0A4Z0NF94_9HYPH|nr:hypothetical protein [Methylobacterium nonmethylotrophicum]TGD93721.1 hypothetical protein EU555_33065 [Methylobacterium nonmethylotrophicum]
MALSSKPTRPAPKPADPVEAFINKGGSVPAAEPAADSDAGKPAKAPQHPLKFPHDSDLFERVERARRATVVRLPRNTWILQAIAEKLERDGH